MQSLILSLMFLTGIIFAAAGAYTAFVLITCPTKQNRGTFKRVKTKPIIVQSEESTDNGNSASPLNKIESRESFTEMECVFEEADLKERIAANVNAQDKKYSW